MVDKEGNPWWVAKEVCDILGLSNVTVTLAGLDDDRIGHRGVRADPGGPGPAYEGDPGPKGI